MATRIGLRELRQHASRWVERAEGGERIEVTRHGQLVAVLTGARDGGDRLAELEAAGKVTRPSASGLPPLVEVTTPLGQALRDLRDEERW